MTTLLTSTTFFNAGWCRQLAYFAGRGSLRTEKFYAVFVYFEHPSEGPCLIDTGYSEAFWAASRQFPERLYRWATPVTIPSSNAPADSLAEAAIDPTSIRRIFVSHFHADHIGGLRCFDNAEFVYRTGALSELMRKPRRVQVHHGFLPGLLPTDFEQRGVGISDNQFSVGAKGFSGLPALDYFGDGSLLLVDLPGHALGHTGYLLNSITGPMLYVVDACWDKEVMLSGKRLPWLSRALQQDFHAYQTTQQKLVAIAPEVRMVACHCPQTQTHVKPA